MANTQIIVNETWRSIDGFINYQVSNIGRVRNANTGRIMKTRIMKNNYEELQLQSDGKKVSFLCT